MSFRCNRDEFSKLNLFEKWDMKDEGQDVVNYGTGRRQKRQDLFTACRWEFGAKMAFLEFLSLQKSFAGVLSLRISS